MELNEQARSGSSCRSCGAANTGRFCAQCGAAAGAARPAEPGLRDDVLETLGWDGRLLRTVRHLLLRPTRVIRAHMEGGSHGYLPPVKLFFTLIAIYMLLGSVVRPISADQIEALELRGPEGATVGERLRARGLSRDHFIDRMNTRWNALYPVTAAVSLLPLVLLLRRWDRRRTWRQHLIFLMTVQSSRSLYSVVVMPLVLLSSRLNTPLGLLAILAVLAMGVRGLYPGRTRGGTVRRVALLFFFHFVVAGVMGLLLAKIVIESAFRY